MTYQAGELGFTIDTDGAELMSAAGTGTDADPIVVRLRVTRVDAFRLRILRPKPERTADSWSILGNSLRFAMTLVVTNSSPLPWTGYDVELEEKRGEPSGYGDGLSFDQLQSFERVRLGSDRFADMHWAPEPHDAIRFRRGSLNVGEVARMAFAVTDLSPVTVFYLKQEPKLAIASATRPPGRAASHALPVLRFETRAAATGYPHGGRIR